MADFCSAHVDLGLVENLLSTVDCNVRAVSELGYRAVSAPGSQLAAALTILMTLYIAVFGLRVLLGLAPLRVGDLTVTVLKIGLVLALVTSWSTYQHVVFDTLFRGPEQLAASMMGAMQPGNSRLRGNPFDGLQISYDQLQAAAAFFVRISPAAVSPFSGGVAFAGLTLNLASYMMLFSTLGVILAAKVVLGLLLALGPVFIAFLLFDSTRGVFEGWLRAALAFAFVPLFATLTLVVQLGLTEPYLVALSRMRTSGTPDLPAATSVFVLTVITSGVSLAGVVAIFIAALGFRLPLPAARHTGNGPGAAAGRAMPVSPLPTALPAAANPLQPRVAAISSATASLDRRDARAAESGDGPHRLVLGARAGGDTPDSQHASKSPTYRRSAQPRRAASSARRDQ
jgi:type IV secretion system protein VirB6